MVYSVMCPKYEKLMKILGKKWTGLVLRSLVDGPRRFSEISAYVEGISDRLLSERLQELEREGIVERQVVAQRPVTVEYVYTKRGSELRKVVDSIQEWANRWLSEEAAPER